MALVFFYATLGGMKGITYTQVAQYVVLITAYLIPAVFISMMFTGILTAGVAFAVYHHLLKTQPLETARGAAFALADAGATVTLTATGRDPNGFADINRVYFQVYGNSSVPVNSCHGMYDRALNAFYLYNDALTILQGPLTPGA